MWRTRDRFPSQVTPRMSLCSSSHPVSDLRRRAGKPSRTRSNSKPTGSISKRGKPRPRCALLELYDHAKEAVPFLKLKMRPLKITSGQAKALLLKLNSGDEHLWKTAFEELEYLDPRLAIGLPEMMERVTEPPGRQRLVEVLSEREAGSLAGKEIKLLPAGEGFNFFARGEGSWWAEPKVANLNSNRWSTFKRKWTRAERAIALLEHVQMPEAIALLKDMAAGHPDAVPTKRTGRPWSVMPQTGRNWKIPGLTLKNGKARLHALCCTCTSIRRKPSRFSRTR